MTPLRGLKGCCHLLFCGNGIDFYSAPSGLNFPTCNLSTGLHPVLIYDTASGLERLLPFVVLWQRNRFLFPPFWAEFSPLQFIHRASPFAYIFFPFGALIFFPFFFFGERNRFLFRPFRAEFSHLPFITGLHPVLIYDTPSGLERLLPFVVLWQTLEEGKPDNLRVASAKITVYRERPNSTRPERLLINSEG